MTTDFALPDWKPPPHERSAISDAAYLDWLNEERLALIRSGELEKLQADPARCPVDVRFIL
jgi:hypothetical protein